MKAYNRKELLLAMIKEVNDQIKNGNLSPIIIEEIPEGRTVILGVWKMKRKKDTKTHQINKWKSILNVYGSIIEKGIHYDKVYPPVAGWSSIRILLIPVVLEVWETTQVDYFQALT